MISTKAMEQFQTYVEQQSIITNEEMFYFLQERSSLFERKLQESIIKISEMQNIEDIAYIHFAFLRAHIIDGTYIWYVQIQGKDGDLDCRDAYICIDMSEFFLPLQKFQENLRLESKKYVGKLSEAEIDLLKLSEFDKYIHMFYLLGTKAFKNNEMETVISKLNIESSLQITIGEYMGTRQAVYVYRPNGVLPFEAPNVLYEDIKEGDWKCLLLQFSRFSGCDCIEESIVCKNLFGSSFFECRFHHMELSLCNFQYVEFCQVSMESTDFWNCTMNATSFINTTLREVSFSSCRFDKADWQEGKMTSPGMVESSFSGSELNNVHFVECDLRYCDFRDTTMTNVVFTDCILSGAKIGRENLKNITLSTTQLEQMVIS